VLIQKGGLFKVVYRMDRDINPWVWGSRVATPQIVGSRGGRSGRGGHGRVVKYYYILLCTGSMFDSGDF